MAAAGFNTVHFWEGIHLDHGLDDAKEFGLQVIFHIEATSTTLPLGHAYPYTDTPVVDAVRKFGQHPSLLAWFLEEEPSGLYYQSAQNTTEYEQAFARFLARKEAIAAVDPSKISAAFSI